MSIGDTVRVALLGEIALRRAGVLTPVPGARSRLLVAALATHPGRSRAALALIDDIWGDAPPRAPMNALHTQISRLRSALPDGALDIGPAGYRLVLPVDQVDLTRVARIEQRARAAFAAGDVDGCLDLLTRARGLWRGEPGADLPPGPVADELGALAAARAHDLDTLELAAREAAGDLTAAIVLARRAATAHPLDEPAHTTLMRLLTIAGRGSEALDVFAAFRARLAAELGTDPGPTITAVNTAILRGDPLPGELRRWRPAANSVPALGTDQPHGGRGTGAGGGDGHAPDVGATVAEDADGRSRGGGAPVAGDADEHVRGEEAAVAGGREGLAHGVGEPVVEDVDGRSFSAAVAYHAAAHRSSALQDPPCWESAAAEAISSIGLRAAPNPLLGRDADLAALTALLRESRVVTVLGPGGTGKTRVANELGARCAAERSVVLVELASVRPDPDSAATRVEVEAAIAATLGVSEVGRDATVLRPALVRDIRQVLRETLGSRPMLLILDNCEHLIEAVAAITADLVGASDRLTVLTTSRAPLEITAETVYPLSPLTIDAAGSPATDLFTARARAVRPSAHLDPAAVARLCETLDGLPLAIELAAARVRTMSVAEIESRLDQRFALLRGGDRSSPRRHRTLHAVIDWSWNLLDDPQRVALRRLCRFPAGFTLPAAEALLHGPDIPDAAAAVDGLVGQSLLTVLEADDDPEWRGAQRVRYRMLETVREFGEEQLTLAGEADPVMARMVGWARDFVVAALRAYLGGDQVRTVLSVAAEAENLVAVLRYAVERRDADTVHMVFPTLAMLWVIRGAHMELVAWGERVLRLPPRTPAADPSAADLQIFGQVTIGLHLMYISGEPRGTALVRNTIRRVLRSGAQPTPMFGFLGELATLPPNATALGRALARGVRSDDALTRSTALLVRANVAENAGDIFGSTRDAVAALRMMEPGDVWGHAMLCQHLGGMYGQAARYDESVGFYRSAVADLLRLRSFEESIEIRSFLAVSLTGLGDTASARRELEPTLGAIGVEPSPDTPVTQPSQRRAHVVSALSEVELAEGDIDTGLRRFRTVLPLLDWPNNMVTPGPGLLMLVSAVVDAHVLYGRTDEIRTVVYELADLVVNRLAQLWDVPQLGAAANAVGSFLLAVGEHVGAGLALLALVPRVTPRQDYPSMRWDRHVALHRDEVGPERFDAAVRAVARLGRRQAAERILGLLREIAPS